MSFQVISLLTLLLLLYVQIVSSTLDMGTCGCICGNNSTNVTVLVRSGPNSFFYDRIRGPRGETGEPGIIGHRGLTGLQGLRGVKGVAGIKGQKGENFADLGSRMKPAKSCFHLLQTGNVRSGTYTIQPTAGLTPYQVYCDMESAGGGWTLVASVHENNIQGKCTVGDKWSSEQGDADEKYKGSSNWENHNTFGRPEGATSDDYKSMAYFNLQASDVMVWHVPNDVDINQTYSEATLKYYTDTGFLTDYGGTLQSLYSKHYPLVIGNRSAIIVENTTALMTQFNRSSATIASSVPSFYRYTYDGGQNYINDGGRNMFDNGNRLYYRIGSGPEILVTYNKHFRHPNEGVDILAATSYPFNAFMWVVSGTGANYRGTYRTTYGSITKATLVLNYHAYTVYSASVPALSEVFYYVKDVEEWESVPPSGFARTPWSSGTDNLQHGVRVTGSPSSILMGYMLLSRYYGYDISDSYIRTALSRTLDVINANNLPSALGCRRLSDSLVQPIVYLKGNNEQVMRGIPPIANSSVTPGYLQFRSFTHKGVPNALCPGIKSETCSPQSVCIGGINSYPIEEKHCGDFAGWDGSEDDSPTSDAPDGAARSKNDLKKSILIFTRKQN